MPAFASGVPGLRPFTSLGFATSIYEEALDERFAFPFLLYFKKPGDATRNYPPGAARVLRQTATAAKRREGLLWLCAHYRPLSFSEERNERPPCRLGGEVQHAAEVSSWATAAAEERAG